jgi:hypothetical protein
MWTRMKKMVNTFNGVFNSRESRLDQQQSRHRDRGSIEQFIEDETDKDSQNKKKNLEIWQRIVRKLLENVLFAISLFFEKLDAKNM